MSRATAIVLALLLVPSLALAAQGAPAAQAAPAQFQNVATDVLFRQMTMVAGANGGVDAVAHTGQPSGSGVYSILQDGPSLLRAGSYQGLARDADGALYTFDYSVQAGARLEGEASVPVARRFTPIAFGADGLLYGVNQSGLVRADASRSLSHVAKVHFETLPTMGPDGHLYSCESLRGLVRTDTATGAQVVVARPAPKCTGIAFDAHGLGYYAAFDGTVRTFDPATGANGTVAAAGVPGQMATLAFSGSRLWASWGNQSVQGMTGGVGYFELGVQGFEGFRPSFQMPPLPDLSVVEFREERAPLATPAGETENGVNEVRTLVLTVRNEGPAPSVPAPVYIWRSGFVPDLSGLVPAAKTDATDDAWNATLPALAPGASVTLEFAWDTTGAVGRQMLLALVDHVMAEGEANLEVDEGDNEAIFHTVVRAPLGVNGW